MIEKMKPEDISELFGGSIPIAAVNLMSLSSSETLIQDFRPKLEGMAILWKSLQQTLLDTRSFPMPPFVQAHDGGGTVVMHGPLQIVVGVLSSEKLAAEVVVLLNLGYQALRMQQAQSNAASIDGAAS